MQSDEVRRGFVEAIQQWTHKTSNDLTTLLPDNQELQRSDGIIVKKPIHLKQDNKALRYTLNANTGVSFLVDVIQAPSYRPAVSSRLYITSRSITSFNSLGRSV